jgi:hypothetical protein
MRSTDAVADGITDIYLAMLARVYVELVRRGSGSVTARLVLQPDFVILPVGCWERGAATA